MVNTKEKIKHLFIKCAKLVNRQKCIWKCEDCTLSDRYEDASGMRIEQLARADIELLSVEEIIESNI